MAPQSILLNLSPQIVEINYINPPSFIDTEKITIIFNSQDITNNLTECISIVQSIPNETQLIINMISSEGT